MVPAGGLLRFQMTDICCQKILRRFDSLSEAITTLESEGKLDLSYNRDLAIRDALYSDKRSRTNAVEMPDGLWVLVRDHDLTVMTKYRPFHGVLSDAPLTVAAPVDANGGRVGLASAHALVFCGTLSNTPANRRSLALANLIARGN
jgi:hypothetical protein